MAAQHQNASLYVGDLPHDVTEAMLFDLFKAVGPVLSIRVCRDAGTRRSLGYAYVNFQNPHDAERALETLNYHLIKGKPIRIMWSHRDPGLRKSGAGNIFIKNLHKSIDNQTLYDTFSQFGNILSCKVATDLVSQESRGYGFVHFENEESAKAAIERVNGMLLKSLPVFVGRFVRRTQRQQQNQAEYTNVYIKEMKVGLTEEELNKYFAEFGEIANSCLKTDKKGRPFAFVNYKTHAAAAAAVAQSHDKEVAGLATEGKKLYVQRAQRKTERQDELRKKFAQLRAKRINEYSGSNLYVKNLDDTVDDKQLRAAFERFGEITSARVMTDDKGVSRGFGFVCFREVEAANKAISDMNGHILGTKPLYVNVAQRKEVRRATLEIQYAARSARPGGPVPAPAQPLPGGYPQMYAPSPYFAAPAGPAGYPYMLNPAAAGRGAGMLPQAGPKWAQQGPGGPMGPMGAPGGFPALPGQGLGAMGPGGRPQGMPQGAMGPRGPSPQQQQRAPGGGMMMQQQQQPRMAPQVPQQQMRPGGVVPGAQVARGMAGPGMGAVVPPSAGMVAKPAAGAMGVQAQVQYTKQARNKEQVMAGAVPVAVPATAQAASGAGGAAEPLTAEALAHMDPEAQKNALGERLFTRINETHPEHAAKITGMLLEMDVAETLNLLESPEVLRGKIEEALEVLKQHTDPSV